MAAPTRSAIARSASCEDLAGWALGVERADPLGLGAGELVVGGGDAREELGTGALEAVGGGCARGLARAGGGGRDAQQQRAVGLRGRRWRGG